MKTKFEKRCDTLIKEVVNPSSILMLMSSVINMLFNIFNNKFDIINFMYLILSICCIVVTVVLLKFNVKIKKQNKEILKYNHRNPDKEKLMKKPLLLYEYDMTIVRCGMKALLNVFMMLVTFIVSILTLNNMYLFYFIQYFLFFIVCMLDDIFRKIKNKVKKVLL